MEELSEQEQYFKQQPIIANAIRIYDGSIPFDYWLNNFRTTRSMMRSIETILSSNDAVATEYLQRIGQNAEVSELGIYVGKIYAIVPISAVREIHIKFQNKEYSSEKSFLKDCKRVHSIFEIPHKPEKVASYMWQLLSEGKSIQELSDSILLHFFKLTNSGEISKIYSKQIRKAFYKKLTQLLTGEQPRIQFTAAFCLGFFFKLKLLNRQFGAYRSKKDYQTQLETIVSAFFHFFKIDNIFSANHLEDAMTEFLRNEKRIVERLHWFYVSKEIYKAINSNQQIPFVMSIVKNYATQYSLVIKLDEHALLSIFAQLPVKSLGWLNKNLETALTVELP